MEENEDRTRDGSQNTHRPSGFSLRSTRPNSSQEPSHHPQEGEYHLSSYSSTSQTSMTSLDPQWNNNNNTLNNSLHQNEQKISLPPLTTLESLHTRLPVSFTTITTTEHASPPKRPRTDSVQLPPIPMPSHKESPQTFRPSTFSLPSIHFTLPPPSIPSANPVTSRSLDFLHIEPKEQVSLPAVSTLLSLSPTSTQPPIIGPQPTYPSTYPRQALNFPRSPQQNYPFSPSGGFQYGMLSPSPHPPPGVLHSPLHQTSFHPSPSPQIVAAYSSTPSLSHPSHPTIPSQTDTMRSISAQPGVPPAAASSSGQRPKPGTDTAWVNSTFFQIRWEQNYSQLKQFYQLYGHSNVTRAEGQWKPLGNWVAEQRRKLKKGKLTPDQVKKLNELGFEWDRSYYFQQGRDSSEDEVRTPTGLEDKPSPPSNIHNYTNNNNNTPSIQPRNNGTGPPTEPQQSSGAGTGGS